MKKAQPVPVPVTIVPAALPVMDSEGGAGASLTATAPELGVSCAVFLAKCA